MSEEAEVPFVEQLRSVPKEFRVSREIQWAEDGTPTGHQFIPVGFMFHRAADELERLARPEGGATIAHVLPLPPQPETITTSTHGPGATFTTVEFCGKPAAAPCAIEEQCQYGRDRDLILNEAANRVLEIRYETVMSKYATQAECRAARDALWEAALAIKNLEGPPTPQKDESHG